MQDQTTYEKLEEMHEELIGTKCSYIRNGLKTGIIQSITITKDGVVFDVVDSKVSNLVHKIKLDKIRDFKYRFKLR